ncbi:MAG: 4Fe-4S dicluster domain-containing protein [Myxococcales bacterium]|nr:4Fe-4S dicluster domain-containing protein [Myxococcales bacterium]
MNDKNVPAKPATPLVSPERLVGRRDFVALAGLSAAMAGVSGCIRRPEEKILPYTLAPEYTVPGVPLHFATVLSRAGESVGLLVESHEGRPTKIEGNPEHPASLGSTDAALQAELLNLYDSDRSRHVQSESSPDKNKRNLSQSSWGAFETFLGEALGKMEASKGAGVRFLGHPSVSMTERALREEISTHLPLAKFMHYETASSQPMWQGTALVFGRPLCPHYDYQRARVILSLDSDFLYSEPGSVRAMRGFTEGRQVYSEFDRMSRLYVVEPTLTLTGTNADHRLSLGFDEIERYLMALALELVQHHGLALPDAVAGLGHVSSQGIAPKWIRAVAKDLATARGRGIIVVGRRQPARVHALAHALNIALENTGRTVRYTRPTEDIITEGDNDLATLAGEMKRGEVETLFILDANPVYDAPRDLDFEKALERVPTTIHLGSHVDETAHRCRWHLPLAHGLESWGDARSRLGTWAIQQPLIAPLFGGRSVIELLAMVLKRRDWRGYGLVRSVFRANWKGLVPSWEQGWRQALHSGVIANTEWAFEAVALEPTSKWLEAHAEDRRAPTLGPESLQVVFCSDPRVDDGRSANNPWLLELPDPVTKMCWDNPALISPKTAKALHLASQDMIKLRSADGKTEVELPVWLQAGIADFTVAVTLGWGRTKAGRYAAGFDVGALRQSDAPSVMTGLRAEKLGRAYKLTRTQEHTSMEGRPLALSGTLAQYHAQPDFPQYASVEPEVGPLWKEKQYTGHKWGMSIDLNACTGCNACVIACQSENNIPTVGKEEVRKGREMQWIRIDHYIEESAGELDTVFQPVACQHCEEAPCENVCPVNATTHSPEGLNDMAYNRCIGTRYCANNCPYKVRRFNYLNYQGNKEFMGEPQEVKQMQFNPDVTVRMRGVMEKCTYCVQRIEQAKIATRVSHTELKDGDIVPACAQACPSHAIVFGDLNDKSSLVAKLGKQKRGYHLLAEVGTQPRTRYLAKLRNTNPEMQS